MKKQKKNAREREIDENRLLDNREDGKKAAKKCWPIPCRSLFVRTSLNTYLRYEQYFSRPMNIQINAKFFSAVKTDRGCNLKKAGRPLSKIIPMREKFSFKSF